MSAVFLSGPDKYDNFMNSRDKLRQAAYLWQRDRTMLALLRFAKFIKVRFELAIGGL